MKPIQFRLGDRGRRPAIQKSCRGSEPARCSRCGAPVKWWAGKAGLCACCYSSVRKSVAG